MKWTFPADSAHRTCKGNAGRAPNAFVVCVCAATGGRTGSCSKRGARPTDPSSCRSEPWSLRAASARDDRSRSHHRRSPGCQIQHRDEKRHGFVSVIVVLARQLGGRHSAFRCAASEIDRCGLNHHQNPPKAGRKKFESDAVCLQGPAWPVVSAFSARSSWPAPRQLGQRAAAPSISVFASTTAGELISGAGASGGTSLKACIRCAGGAADRTTVGTNGASR